MFCQESKVYESAASEHSQKTDSQEVDGSCSTASSCCDDASSDPDCEFQTLEVRAFDKVAKLKLIFLDMDGPLVAWKDGDMHKWQDTDTLDDLPYVHNVDALQRVINAAGGAEVVKIVITSNWRTDEERYPWLVSQLAIRGIDVIGHTDSVRLYPKACESSILRRDLEIHRLLSSRVLGESGPHVTTSGALAFTPTTLPDACEITSWIAIDDLDLGKPSFRKLNDLKYAKWFVSAPGDNVDDKGRTELAAGFKTDFSTWSREFAKKHFVKVDAEAGLAGAAEAESTAIQLLCA